MAFGVVAFSNTMSGGAAPPRSLDPVGMTGCTQYISLDHAEILINQGGSATWIILNPELGSAGRAAGLLFYQQGLVL